MGMLGSWTWPVTVVVLAVIGAATYLGSDHVLAAADIQTVLVLILGALGITTTAHVVSSNLSGPPAPPQDPTTTGKLV